MSDIKRYDLCIISRYSADGEGDIEMDAEMRQSERGEWVKFADLQVVPQPPALGGEPEPFGYVYRVDEEPFIKLNGDQHIKDGMHVYCADHVGRLQAEVERLSQAQADANNLAAYALKLEGLLRDCRWRITNKNVSTDDYQRLDKHVVDRIDAALAEGKEHE